MNENGPQLPPWLPELTAQVTAALESITAGKQDRRPAWEAELTELKEKIQGWNASLAKPSLPTAVREAVETQWAAALERKAEIEAETAELLQTAAQAEQLVEPEQVLRRLERLADVLAAEDPTRGNLELSLHIDRIVCYPDNRVQLRMCKLGIVPDAVDLLATNLSHAPALDVPSAKPERARRRGKLRVTDDDLDVDLRAQAHFVADVERFAGLGDEFFWVDEFTIPEASSWASEHAEAVFRRRQTTRASYATLAAEFKVTPPTIGAAIRCFLAVHPEERDIELPRGGKRKPKFDLATIADEARQLWVDGESKEKLAKRFGCSAPTVGKAIAFAYEREGSKMPTRAEARRAQVDEARRRLDADQSLQEIAAALKISDVTTRRLLQESFAAEGKPMPDLRRRPPPQPDS